MPTKNKSVNLSDNKKTTNTLLQEVEGFKKEIKQLKTRKKYGLVWESKPEKVVEMCKEKLPVLKEEKFKEIKSNTKSPVNVLIEGDNYHSLSVLNYTHKGLVDVIYIDPPYNTGNKDFIFNDDYIDKDDSYRHSKWVSFMYSRLKLARNLLSKDGVIFISIDDNEFAQLKLLCDEIFGERNFLSAIKLKVKAPAGVGQESYLFDICEYVLAYAKNSLNVVNRTPQTEKIISTDTTKTYNKILKSFGNDKLVKTISGGIVGKIKVYKHNKYEIETIPVLKRDMATYYSNFNKVFRTTNPQGGLMKRVIPQIPKKGLVSIEYVPSKGRNKGTRYRYYFIDGSLVVWLKDSALKDTENKLVKKNAKNTNLWLDNFHQGIAGEGNVDFKNGKKPVRMIKRLLEMASDDSAVILDFFAGSGTIGQAVLELNNKDSGKRKFILCTDNEENICREKCYPRISNVIKGYSNKKGLGGHLKYYKTDFVDGQSTDKNKKALVDKSTEMLCIKENCFNSVKRGKNFVIFKDGDNKYLGIIYDDDGIEPLKKEVNRLKKKFIVYVFSLDDSAREEEFEDVGEWVEPKPIPAVILNVYKRVFR
ncbi:MAG: site-specific DNA-methyltransferase [Candidatus Komeilibacteria bacterium]|jgi:adenine-specific DNA-methyltransferase|nr:site-specific DNA-methyltransferase [Candidatus Komeilibacteria bacterium]MBT4447532.1 site-specific DNA-methyltransferase [Candidatus Komeilibacteria bacterium]